MTLVLSLLTPHYALQVSDRLVTRSGSAFDPLANKSVIYHARDAIVTIGYSGLAYLEGVPTDKWIAQKLTGEEFEGRFALRQGPILRWLDIGQSVELIRRECEALFSRLEPSTHTTQQFLVAGWQWGRRIARPITWRIENSHDPYRQSFTAHAPPRYWHYQHPLRFRLSWIPRSNPLPKRELVRLMEHLRGTVASPEASERLLIKAVRLAARKSSAVGPHCMSILVAPPVSGLARARYVPTTTAKARVVGGSKKIVAPAAFSPWVVGPRLVAAPSILVAAWHLRSSPFAIDLEAPPVPTDSAIAAAVSSQRRPLDPLGPKAAPS